MSTHRLAKARTKAIKEFKSGILYCRDIDINDKMMPYFHTGFNMGYKVGRNHMMLSEDVQNDIRIELLQTIKYFVIPDEDYCFILLMHNTTFAEGMVFILKRTEQYLDAHNRCLLKNLIYQKEHYWLERHINDNKESNNN